MKFESPESEEKYKLIERAFANDAEHKLIDWPFKIYGKADASIWAAVDEDDYLYFRQWLWSYAKTPRGKIYIKRSSGNAIITRDGETIGRMRGKQQTIYLHRAIMKRSGVLPPTPEHKIVDHRNGNSLDCRKRSNLRWATYAMNSVNLHGSHPAELGETVEIDECIPF
jgi:hypothetical protein